MISKLVVKSEDCADLQIILIKLGCTILGAEMEGDALDPRVVLKLKSPLEREQFFDLLNDLLTGYEPGSQIYVEGRM